MILKELDQITSIDFQDLVAHQVREGKTLEYKKEFPTGNDDSVKKFLAGVSAMANTSGGDFIIGVEAKNDGVAVAVPGVPLTNLDQDELRLENWIRDCIEPRLPHYDIRSIPANDPGKYVIIVRVPQSWLAPHRVTYKGHDKFYGRNSAGKYPLDVSELRTAFTLSEQIAERIRNFRVERITTIAGDEAPLPLSDKGKLLLHLIPLSAFTSLNDIDVVACYQKYCRGDPRQLPTPNDSRGDICLTFEGLLVHNALNQSMADYYTLLFRTGILEAVYTFLPHSKEKYINSEGYEKDLWTTFPQYLQYLSGIGIEPPLFMFLTLVGVKGYKLAIGENLAWRLSHDNEKELRKDVLQLPGVVLETLEAKGDNDAILRSLFNLVWNAFGYSHSYNFDQNGEWIGQR